jgi:hypothetical protein
MLRSNEGFGKLSACGRTILLWHRVGEDLFCLLTGRAKHFLMGVEKIEME